MEEIDTHTYLSSALTEEEWSQIPDEIGKKLFTFVNEKVGEILTSKAIFETNKTNAETSLNELEESYKISEDALLISNNKLDAAVHTIEELESQISINTADIVRLHATSNKLEAENAEFRHQRNLAYGERDELAKTLERCSAEVERLQTKVTGLTKQLQGAVTAKCEAQLKVHDLKTQLDKLKKEIDLLKEENETYRVEKTAEHGRLQYDVIVKHSEVLRKVETRNAIIDSLRIERDTLLEQITQRRITRALTLSSEALRTELNSWRQRVNMLKEKSNHTSPEDWKKLQNERGNQLTIERGNSAKLADELNTTKQGKSKLEKQLRNLQSQHHQLGEEVEKNKDKMGKLWEQFSNFARDLDQIREAQTKLNEEKKIWIPNSKLKLIALQN